MNKFNWFSRGFNSREPVDANGWLSVYLCLRVEIECGNWEIQESTLMGTEFSMDFPFMNANLTGLHNKCGYAQVIKSKSCSECGLAKYGGLMKFYFDEP
ncbi:hypothetical protein ACJRO7_013619, partial [Eucalyptus globulus]